MENNKFNYEITSKKEDSGFFVNFKETICSLPENSRCVGYVVTVLTLIGGYIASQHYDTVKATATMENDCSYKSYFCSVNSKDEK